MSHAVVELNQPPKLHSKPTSRADRRLRARRLRAHDLNLDRLAATATHPGLGNLEATVEDLSLSGMALVVEDAAHQASLVHVGDRLTRLEVSADAAVFFTGTAGVRRVSERDGSLVLGVALEQAVDLAALYRLGTRHSFSERLAAVMSANDQELATGFKAWVADLRSYLESTRAFLDSEERALSELDRLSREQALEEYLAEVTPQLVDHLNRASAELRDLVSDFDDDQHAAHRAYFKTHVLPLFAHSPLLCRAQQKPLGYAGDYEMMNMLYRDHAEGDSLFGRALNVYGAQEPAAQANINRLRYLGEKIRTAIEARGRVRVASVGCGPARELGKLLEESPELGPFVDVALIDQEDRVITYCERTLSPLAARTGARIQFIRESVRRLLTAKQLSATLGERDIIYSAGLFDYLNRRSFSALIGALYEALSPGGQLIVGNVAADNPTRHFMEYCLDWYLIHRTPEELLDFAKALQPTPSRMEVDAEPLGVNLFLRVWK